MLTSSASSSTSSNLILRRFRLFSGGGGQVQPAAVEVNGMNEVLLVTESASSVLDPLDLGIDGFTGGIGDSMLEISDDVGESALEHARHLDHRLQTAAHRQHHHLSQ